MLSQGLSDSEILSVLDQEFPKGMFKTTNAKAIAGTKWDFAKKDSRKTNKMATRQLRDPLDRPDLIKDLQDFDAGPVIEHYWKHDLANKSPAEILVFSFGSGIFRAFHHESPKQRYLKWRWHQSPDKLIGNLDGLENQYQFDQFLFGMGDSLVADWGATNDKGKPARMNIGYAMKISNLVLKHLTFSLHIQNSKLIDWLHVPWDSYTLAPLRKICQDPLIPKTAGQGFVKNLETYQKLHFLISEIAKETHRPRIHYEFYAWDLAHQNG